MAQALSLTSDLKYDFLICNVWQALTSISLRRMSVYMKIPPREVRSPSHSAFFKDDLSSRMARCLLRSMFHARYVSSRASDIGHQRVLGTVLVRAFPHLVQKNADIVW